MFMQIIQGTVADPEAAKTAMDRRLAPRTVSWLGGTDDGTLVAAVRFDSGEAARATVPP